MNVGSEKVCYSILADVPSVSLFLLIFCISVLYRLNRVRFSLELSHFITTTAAIVAFSPSFGFPRCVLYFQRCRPKNPGFILSTDSCIDDVASVKLCKSHSFHDPNSVKKLWNWQDESEYSHRTSVYSTEK